MFARFFQDIKNNPITAANVGGCLSSTVASIPLYVLYYDDILFDDMNTYAAQAIIGAIGFGAYVVGAVASALAQQYYSRRHQDQSEHALIINDTGGYRLT